MTPEDKKVMKEILTEWLNARVKDAKADIGDWAIKLVLAAFFVALVYFMLHYYGFQQVREVVK